MTGVLAEVTWPAGAASLLDCVPSPRLVAADDEADVPEVPRRAVALAEGVPFAPFEPVPGVLDVVGVATAASPRLRGGDAIGTAGGGDEGCVVLVVAGDGWGVVAGAVVALVALPAVVSPGPLPLGPVEVAAVAGEDALGVVLDVSPLAAAGAGVLVEAAGALLVVAAPERLLVEVVVAPGAGVGDVVAKGTTEGLVELAVEPGTVVPPTLVEVVVAAGAGVGEVVPGGAPGTLVEVELVEVTLVVLGTALAPEVVVVVPRTLVELEPVVLVVVVALVGVESGQGGFAWSGWVVAVPSPRTVVLVLLRGLVVVVVVMPPAAVVVVVAGATVVCAQTVVVVVEDAARVAVATEEVVVVLARVAAAAVAAKDTAPYARVRDASALNQLQALRAALYPQPRDGKAHPGPPRIGRQNKACHRALARLTGRRRAGSGDRCRHVTRREGAVARGTNRRGHEPRRTRTARHWVTLNCRARFSNVRVLRSVRENLRLRP